MISFLRLIRTNNLLIIAITQFFAFYFLSDHFFHDLVHPGLFLLVFSTVLIAAGGNIINDYMDVKLDIINKPKQVVVGKHIARRTAIILHISINLIALAIGYYLSLKIMLIHLLTASVLYLYSEFFKRQFLIGNVVIGILTSLVLIILWIYDPSLDPRFILAYSVFAFLITLIREIIKDVEDIKGDKQFNCKTLAVVLGLGKTRKVLLFLLFCLAITTLLFLYLFLESRRYMSSGLIYLAVVYAIILILLPMGIMFYTLWSADTKKEYSLLSKMAKFLMVTGTCSMIFLK